MPRMRVWLLLCATLLSMLLCGCSGQSEPPQKPMAGCNIDMSSNTEEVFPKSFASTTFMPELFVDRYTLPQVYGFYCKVNAALMDYANKHGISLNELETAYDYVVFYLNYKVMLLHREFPVITSVEFSNETLREYDDGRGVVLNVTQSIRYLTDYGPKYESYTDTIYIGKGNRYIGDSENLWYLRCSISDSSPCFSGEFLPRNEGEAKLDALLQVLHREWPDQYGLLYRFPRYLTQVFNQDFFPDVVSVQLVEAAGLDVLKFPRTGKMLMAEDAVGNTYVYYECKWCHSELLCNDVLVALSHWVG